MTSFHHRASTLSFALALVTTVSGSSCFLTDADIPSDVELVCDNTADCPPTWTCNATTQLCNAPGGIVFDGPAVLNRTHFGPKSEVEIQFSLSDAVQSGDGALVVELRDLDTRESIADARFLQTSAEDRTFSFSLDGEDVQARGIPEGRYAITVLATSADNVASVLSADTVEWDSTPPEVETDATIVDGRLGGVLVDGLEALLPVVSGASNIVATVVANEEISPREDEPVVVELQRDGTVAATFTVDTIGLRDARLSALPLGETLNTGVYDMVVASLADLAGNPLDEPVIAGQVFVDIDDPVFDLFVASPTLVSRENPVVTLCAQVQDVLLLAGQARVDGESGDAPFRVGASFLGTDVACRSEDDGLDACAPAATGSRTFECTLDTHVDDNPVPIEDAFVVFGVAEDIAGNVVETTDVVVIDTAPANLVGGSVRLVGPPLSTVANPRALTTRSAAAITINVDELVQANSTDNPPTAPPAYFVCPPDSPPTQAGDGIVPGPGHFPLVPSPQAAPPASFYAYTVGIGLLPNAIDPPEGACAIEFWLTDVAGNFSVVRAQNDGQFVAVTPLTPQTTDDVLVMIDQSPPDVASTSFERLLHVRAPWGLPANTVNDVENVNSIHAIIDTEEPAIDETGDIPDVGVEALADPTIARDVIDPAYAQGVVSVLLYDREEALTPIGFIAPTLIGDGSEADPIASWGPAVVGTADAVAVWMRLIDEAGNLSAPVRIDHGMWFATINRKIAGVNFQNPHALFSQPSTGATLSVLGANQASLPAPGQNDLDLVTGAGASFAQRISSSRPPRHAFSAMATNTVNGRTYLFGGDTTPRSTPTGTNALWTFNGRRWENICTSTAECGIAPRARFEHMMAYDARNNRVTIAGGVVQVANGTFDVSKQTFAFADDEFLPMNCSQATNGDCGVLNVRGGAAAYDTERAAIWVAGGCPDVTCSELDQGSLNLGVVKDEQIERVTSAGPANRHRAAFAFDSSRSVFVLHGGCADLDCTTKLRDTWTFDPVDRTWTEITTTTSFSDQGASPKLVFLPEAFAANGDGVLVLIGASRSGDGNLVPFLGELFAFTGSDWAPIDTGPDAAPQPFENVFSAIDAEGFAAVADANGRMLTMGGVDEEGGSLSRDPLATRIFTRNGTSDIDVNGTLVSVPNIDRTTFFGTPGGLSDSVGLHSPASLFHSPSASVQDGSLSVAVMNADPADEVRIGGCFVGRFEGDGFVSTPTVGAAECNGFIGVERAARFTWATSRTLDATGDVVGHSFQYTTGALLGPGDAPARYGSFLRGERVGSQGGANYFALADDASNRPAGEVLRQANPDGDLFLTGFINGGGAGNTSVLRYVEDPNTTPPVWNVVAQPNSLDQLPPAFSNPAVAYSPPAGIAVMANGSRAGPTDTEDTGLVEAVWAFNGNRWTRLELTNTEGERPREVAGATLEWHTDRQRFVMAGGSYRENGLLVCEDAVWELQINPNATATFLPVQLVDPEGDGDPRPRHDATTAFGSDGMMMASGNAMRCDGGVLDIFLEDAWSYRSAFENVPGQIFQVNVAAAALPTQTRFLVAGSSWTAGASAPGGNGVVNAIWSSGRWVPVGDDNNAPASLPRPLASTVKVEASADLDRIFVGDNDAIHIMMRAKHGNEAGFAQLRTVSSPLVFLRYLLP